MAEEKKMYGFGVNDTSLFGETFETVDELIEFAQTEYDNENSDYFDDEDQHCILVSAVNRVSPSDFAPSLDDIADQMTDKFYCENNIDDDAEASYYPKEEAKKEWMAFVEKYFNIPYTLIGYADVGWYNLKEHHWVERKEFLTNLFPELRESEEDMIRKLLIEAVIQVLQEQYCSNRGVSKEKVVAWLEKQKEPELSEDLGEYVAELSKQFPEVSFAKLSRIAVRVKNWLEKQGEQKPTDKTEPFDKYEGLTDFERTLADICIGWIGEELGWKQYIKDNADVLLKIAIEKFNSVQDASFEQKPAWSEEDKDMVENMGRT